MIYTSSLALLDGANENIKVLAETLRLPIVGATSNDYKLYLEYRGEALCLGACINSEYLRISVDFLSAKLTFRQQRVSRKSEPMLRAIGCSNIKRLHVVDATAGLGRDAFLMANYNCQVSMLEQSPVLAALLEDGLVRAKSSNELLEVLNRMKLINANAIEYLQGIGRKPDVVYMDPMFPERSKAAKVKKEMQVLHALLGCGDEASNATLLKIALQQAKQRVVVKRPKTAAYLAGQKPSYSLNTKAMRYDIYLAD